MTLFGIRHTIRWALTNTAEFDRRHLHGAGAWLFGRRPVRPQRPPRRIVSLLFLSAWLGLAASVQLGGTSWGQQHINGLATFLSYLLWAVIGFGAAGVAIAAGSILWTGWKRKRHA